MHTLTYFLLFVFLLPGLILCQSADHDKHLQSYIRVLKESGRDPLDFIIDKFQDHDLIIFDDALHTAVEPFEYYQELIKTASFHMNVKYIFLEAISINQQQHLDAYFESKTENVSLLYPAFQNDFNAMGWPYKTYFDLLHSVYVVNRSLPKEQRLKVIAVSNPTYWSEIKTKKDFGLFQKTLRTHDFTMYKTILLEMNNFESGEKGVFLTNTRHAYKRIKNKKGELYWNAGTFFHQWHPDKTYAVRFHNVQLFIEKQETVKILWDRIGEGIWDSAFEKFGKRPIAISLQDNLFGSEPYVGNHMLNVAPNQIMYDAYDGLIFLGPLEKMHKTAIIDFIYTENFKKELKRRYHILYSKERISEILIENDVNSLNELIEKTFIFQPRKLLPQIKSIGPIDGWMK